MILRGPGVRAAAGARACDGRWRPDDAFGGASTRARARRLAAVDSRMFGNEASGGAALFQSNVSVWESPALALRSSPGLRVVRASVTTQPAAFLGMVALRIRLVYSYEARRYPSISDVVVFRRGTGHLP